MSKYTIDGPKANQSPSDRALDCEFVLESAFLEIVEAAVAAGWCPEEVVVAITSLADNYMLGQAANEATDKAIAEAKKGKRGL